MTSRHLANVALRLLGVYWFLSGLLYLPQLLTISEMPDTPESGRSILIASVLAGVGLIVMGVILSCYSKTIAARLFRSDEQLSVAATADELRLVGFHLLGMYFFAGALSRIGGLIYTMSQSRGGSVMDESQFAYSLYANREGIVMIGLELIAGAWLFLGARGLADLARRTARLARSTPSPPHSTE